MTDEDKTPAQKRAELLSDEDRAWLQELAAAAPPLTEEQRHHQGRVPGQPVMTSSNDPMEAVLQYVDAFNNGDAEAMAAGMR